MTVVQQLLEVTRRTAHKAWHSPVGMTWLNQFVAFGSALILLPLILRYFSITEQAVWLTLNLMAMIGMLVDVGVRPTLVRSMAYFWAGADDISAQQELKNFDKSASADQPNWKAIKRLYATSSPIYSLMALLAAVITAVVGMPLACNVIQLNGNQFSDWLALLSICITVAIVVRTSLPTGMLEGSQQVALANRLNAVAGFFRLILSIVIVLIGGKLLEVFAAQGIASVFIYFIINKITINRLSFLREKSTFDSLLMRRLSPAIWRTAGIGGAAFFVNQGTGLAIAQIKDAAVVTSYLLTLRVVIFGMQIAKTPLYARLPYLISCRARNDLISYRKIFLSSAGLSLFLLFIILLFIGIVLNPLLEMIDFNVRVIDGFPYALLATWAFLETHHSAHFQSYITTNHVPFVLPATISGVAIVVGSFIAVSQGFGIAGVVFVPFFVQLICNNWLPVYLNLKLLNWPIRKYFNEIAFSIARAPFSIYQSFTTP